jgi:tripartite-type tricarboxylate transporter receptor subunit TctC
VVARSSIRRREFVASAASLGLAPGFACAQPASYPHRQVRLVVPLPAGSVSDVQGRQLADKLGQIWQRPLLVENRPGASAIIGHDAVARAAPDGYTLLLATIAPLTMLPHLMKLPFAPLTDFVPITRVTAGPIMLVASPAAPFDSVESMVRYSRAHPGELKVGGSGVGTIGHLATLLTAKVTGADLTHVPYSGGPQQVADLVGGQIPLLFDYAPVLAAYIRAGKVRPLATTGSRRSSIVPDVPTFEELGHRGLRITAWQGIVVPARTPPDIVARLHADIAAALASAGLRETLLKGGAEIGGEPPDVFAAFVRAEHARWGELIAANKLKLE